MPASTNIMVKRVQLLCCIALLGGIGGFLCSVCTELTGEKIDWNKVLIGTAMGALAGPIGYCVTATVHTEQHLQKADVGEILSFNVIGITLILGATGTLSVQRFISEYNDRRAAQVRADAAEKKVSEAKTQLDSQERQIAELNKKREESERTVALALAQVKAAKDKQINVSINWADLKTDSKWDFLVPKLIIPKNEHAENLFDFNQLIHEDKK